MSRHRLTRPQAADPDGKGELSSKKVRNALEALSYQVLGLTTFQILSIVTNAPLSPSGSIEYVRFVPVAASMIYSMFDSSAMKHRLNAIHKLAGNESIAELSTLDYTILHQLLTEAFQVGSAAQRGALAGHCLHCTSCLQRSFALPDISNVPLFAFLLACFTVATAKHVEHYYVAIPLTQCARPSPLQEADTTGSGELTYDQVVDVINSLSWEYLSPYHISTMITAIDIDGNGMVDWQELANFLCDVLEHVEREKYIQEQAMAAWEANYA